MIYNDDFLFIHVPKTAGMSLSDALLKSLKGNVVYTVPEGHAVQAYSEKLMVGSRHETLKDAEEWFKENDPTKKLSDFKYIVSMVRNPYDLEVSRYNYLRIGHEWDSGVAQDIALEGDLEKFVLKSKWWFDVEDYYEVNGVIPKNLYIVRYESFVDDFKYMFEECYKSPLEIPSLNTTKHGGAASYLNKSLEQAVYNKYKWIFDKGYYSRAWLSE